MAQEADWTVEALDLVKVYKEGDIRAVDGLNLRIARGEIYALIGANGSGKTTCINILTGVLAPTSGVVKVLGMEMPGDRKTIAKYVGVAPQEYSVYQDLTVEQNVRFFGRLYGISNDQLESRMQELLQILRLDGRRRSVAANLSGGMRRRVSIACALIHNPQLVFFDEATVGIDPVLRAFFWEYFRSLKKQGLTIIITSHVMDEAEKADRIGLIRAGKLIEEGTPKELKKKHNADTIEDVFIKLSEGTIIDE
ncbi:MAG: ABC transporter ATP-binding protein [Thaumarchaeota archaeon]|nr:ABC transporter ATP-binding protein [Nitrososphaerota archaeon]MCL5319155.1 ABC transporter ATP-binding protein [Nitrososphaerota archaeon]